MVEPGRLLWVNPLAKTCPYCWFGEPCSGDQRRGTDGTAHLKDHLMKHHRANCAAYAANAGLKSPDAAAWELVKRARLRRPPEHGWWDALMARPAAAQEVLVEVPLPK